MESISTGELAEITFFLSEDAQNQFQYWLAITFALIVAVTLGKQYLNPLLSAAISALYLATTVLFSFRYYEDMRNIELFVVELESRQFIPYASTSFLFYLRFAIFAVGTIITLWFLYKNSNISDNDT